MLRKDIQADLDYLRGRFAEVSPKVNDSLREGIGKGLNEQQLGYLADIGAAVRADQLRGMIRRDEVILESLDEFAAGKESEE